MTAIALKVGGAVTVNTLVPVTPPTTAEMVVLPPDSPVAKPPAVMVATDVFDELHVAWLVRLLVLPSE